MLQKTSLDGDRVDTSSDGLRVLLEREAVERKVFELAQQISMDFAGQSPVIVGILTGAAQFLIDLLRAMPDEFTRDVEYDFVNLNSYTGTRSSRRPIISSSFGVDITGRDVLLVDGIVDTGHTIAETTALVWEHGPASVKTCIFLNKPVRRQVEVPLDYVGFSIEDVFVVGYGMDFDQRYRALPYIGVIEN